MINSNTQLHISRNLGNQGEDFVVDQLILQGFSIVARNFRHMNGEIDIIAKKRELLIFVEVKLRQNDLIDLAELIIPSKQRKIIYVAQLFLSSYSDQKVTARFDVALVTYKNNHFFMQYIENAFVVHD